MLHLSNIKTQYFKENIFLIFVFNFIPELNFILYLYLRFRHFFFQLYKKLLKTFDNNNLRY